MIGRCLFPATVLCLATAGLFADDPLEQPATTAAASVTRDILYFHFDNPVFIRVHIEVDETSYEDSWRKYVQSMFAYLDENRDGRATREEVAASSNSPDRKLSSDVLRLARDPDLWTADRSPLDAALTIDELTTFLIRSQRGAFQPPGRAPPPTSSNVGRSLFELLDTDASRTLSRDELVSAMTSLHRRDLDDDGTFGVGELQTPNAFVPRATPEPTVGIRPFISLIPGSASAEVLRELERRYTAFPSGARPTLSRDFRPVDLAFDPEVFSAFDLDGDGTLDRDEMREFVRNPHPTLELIIRLGDRGKGEPVVDLIDSAKNQKISLRRSSDGLASVVINDVQIEIAEAGVGQDIARQYLLRQFAAGDRDKNNYIDEKEASRSNTFRESFDQFDEDGDGKLFEDELTAVVDSRTTAARSRTRMNVRNRGRDLFEILDLDRNRSLGRRELAQAVKRIELWDSDNDGVISESEIPQLYQVSFGPGQPQFRGVQIPGQVTAPAENGRTPNSSTPKWFRKLDRNGDGELARREFPGTRAEFQKLDRNSDGVVDAAEAEL